MKKYLDKLKRNIRINKNLFVFLLVIVLVAVASGTIFANILNQSDKSLVKEYLNNFLENAKTGNFNYNISLANTFIFTLGSAIIIWILGISVIGFIFIFAFLFLKAFIIGFSLGSIIINFHFKGILFSLGYIIPHHIINIMIYILLCSYALIVSYKIINSLIKRKTLDFKQILGKYLFILIFSLIILFLTSLYEVYIVPKVMNFLTSILK